MPEPLNSNLDAIAARIRSCDRLLLFSDFDGTLVPIHEHPAECFLDPALGAVLSSLAGHDRLSVGIVSGRELQDLKSRVGISGITYVGNHGLEFDGTDLPCFESLEPDAMIAVRRLVGELANSISAFPGAWIEDKGLTASVHYRQVEPANIAPLVDSIRRRSLQDITDGKVVLRSGKMVVEIRPVGPWNKGTAVRRLADRFTSKVDPMLIYLGDDETDEDVFRTFRRDITICVGGRADTAANFSVRDPQDVHHFISWLSNIVSLIDLSASRPAVQNISDFTGSR